MRLYLSSFRTGDRPDRLTALLGDAGPGDIAVIADALDAEPAGIRRAGVELETAALRDLGFRPREIDLRDFFDRPPAEVAEALAAFPAVWVRGGNVFVLRHALARSGADAALTERLRADTLVYAGYSAGPCVLAPSLRGLDMCDPVEAVARTWGAEPTWEGLGVLGFAFVPHIDSYGHPESEALARVAAHYRASGVPHRTLRDGQVLVVDGPTVELL